MVSLTIRSFGWRVAYFFPEGGVTGSGPRGETLIGDSGSVGAISAPASFTALKVVPGGVSGGRLSMIRFVWFTRSRTAAEITATIAAITTGSDDDFHTRQRPSAPFGARNTKASAQGKRAEPFAVLFGLPGAAEDEPGT